MITASNQQIFPHHNEHYTGESPTIADIATGLGRQPRFAGQTRRYYTVLCHTLVCAELVEDEYKIHALLHDAAESIVSDVCTTWKTREHKENEEEILALISSDLGIEYPWTERQHYEVQKADIACLAAEAHILGHAQAEKWWPKKLWGQIEADAYELTIDMLQRGAPMLFLEPSYSIPYYQNKIARALTNPNTDDLIESINEALQ